MTQKKFNRIKKDLLPMLIKYFNAKESETDSGPISKKLGQELDSSWNFAVHDMNVKYENFYWYKNNERIPEFLDKLENYAKSLGVVVI